jgi:voltage-gated potassium channel
MRLVGSRPGFLWQASILFLILLDSILIFLSLISNLKLISMEYVAVIDLIVSIFLLALFLMAIIPQGNKKLYIKQNLILLVCFIPFYFIGIFSGLIEYLFIFKLLNILKLISLYFFAIKFAREVVKYQEKTRLVYALAIFLLVLFVCSFIFYEAEHMINPQVANYEDSLWFVLQTITTVGYGDIVPQTGIGRLMGVISMLSALALTSIITSVATFSLMEKFKSGTEKLTQRTKQGVENIDKKLNEINEQLQQVDKSSQIEDIKKDIKDIKSDIAHITELIDKKNK